MAIYLNSRGFAFVVFEGELSPLDWSAVETRGSQRRQTLLARIEALFARLGPNMVVLENMAEPGTKRPERIRSLNEAIVQLAAQYALPTVFFSRAEVRRHFSFLGTVTKDAIAMAIAKHIPAFERFLPRPRRPWESEDARMGIFDAAALALIFYQTQARTQQQRCETGVRRIKENPSTRPGTIHVAVSPPATGIRN